MSANTTSPPAAADSAAVNGRNGIADDVSRYRRLAQARRLLEQEVGHTAPTRVTPVAFQVRLAEPGDDRRRSAGHATLLDTDTDADGGDHATAAVAELADPRVLLERCVVFEPVVDPVFDAAMIYGYATRRGQRSFSLSVDAGLGSRGLERLADLIPGELLHTAASWEKGHKAGARTRALAVLVARFGLAAPPAFEAVEGPDSGVLARSAVLLTPNRHGLSIKLLTRPGGWMETGGPAHRWSAGDVLPAVPVTPDDAVRLAHLAALDGFRILDTDRVLDPLEQLVRQSTVVRGVPGMPGLAILAEGNPGDGEPVTVTHTTVAHATRVLDRYREAGQATVTCPRVADAAAMASARPHLDGVLYPPQQKVVAVHLATEYGFLNASSVGSGKCVCTMRGLRAKSRSLPGYRAVVFCAKALRHQWTSELADPTKGFPEAATLIPEGRAVARQLADFDRACGERPGVIIASYEQARLRTDDFRALSYDDMVIDEAARLGNPSTQLARALKRIRERALVAVALTATPIGKSIEELDAIIGFVRQDEQMLRSRVAGRTYSTPDGTSMNRLRRALGPTMVRVTSADLRDHMPKVLAPKHVLLEGTEAERELATAAEQRIAELFAGLLEQVDDARLRDPGDPQLDELRRDLQSKRGLLLSASQVALMAAIDPESLRSSQSVAAALLESEGLVQKAIDMRPTLRTVVAETVAGAIAGGEPTLVFSQYASCLRLLARELDREHDIEVGLFTQQTTGPERERLKQRFMAGELGGLLLGPVGNEGHNLQVGSSRVDLQACKLEYSIVSPK